MKKEIVIETLVRWIASCRTLEQASICLRFAEKNYAKYYPKDLRGIKMLRLLCRNKFNHILGFNNS